MAALRALLVIADISGYTRFMTIHRVNLAHAQDVVARLLEAVIDGASPHLTLSKLEGDAALFYAKLGSNEAESLRAVPQRIEAIRQSFAERRRRIEIDRACTCDGCTQAGELRLKFVVHVGEVALQKVKSFTELAGLDVILVHRMLKNGVPVSEYALMSEVVVAAFDEPLRARATPITENLEGVGATPLHYLDLEKDPIALPETRAASWLGRFWALMKMNLRSLPYILGLKKACEGFRNMGPALGDAPALPPKPEDETPFPA